MGNKKSVKCNQILKLKQMRERARRMREIKRLKLLRLSRAQDEQETAVAGLFQDQNMETNPTPEQDPIEGTDNIETLIIKEEHSDGEEAAGTSYQVRLFDGHNTYNIPNVTGSDEKPAFDAPVITAPFFGTPAVEAPVYEVPVYTPAPEATNHNNDSDYDGPLVMDELIKMKPKRKPKRSYRSTAQKKRNPTLKDIYCNVDKLSKSLGDISNCQSDIKRAIQAQKNKKDNPIENYCKYIGSLLKRLPEARLLEVQHKIVELIKNEQAIVSITGK